MSACVAGTDSADESETRNLCCGAYRGQAARSRRRQHADLQNLGRYIGPLHIGSHGLAVCPRIRGGLRDGLFVQPKFKTVDGVSYAFYSLLMEKRASL
jgi:hypothetical protein